MAAFQKGHPKPAGAGRKRGTPHKITEEVRRLAKEYGPKAIKRLGEIIESKESTNKDVIDASQVILDRAYGRASPLPLGDESQQVGGIKVVIMGDDAKL